MTKCLSHWSSLPDESSGERQRQPLAIRSRRDESASNRCAVKMASLTTAEPAAKQRLVCVYQLLNSYFLRTDILLTKCLASLVFLGAQAISNGDKIFLSRRVLAVIVSLQASCFGVASHSTL